MFGGFDGKKYLSDVFLFDANNNEWTRLDITGKPRALHSATKIDSKVYLFGGLHGSDRLNDTKIFDLGKSHSSFPLFVFFKISAT